MEAQLYSKLNDFINNIEDEEIQEQFRKYVEIDNKFNVLVNCNDCRFHGNCNIEKSLAITGSSDNRFCSYGRK